MGEFISIITLVKSTPYTHCHTHTHTHTHTPLCCVLMLLWSGFLHILQVRISSHVASEAKQGPSTLGLTWRLTGQDTVGLSSAMHLPCAADALWGSWASTFQGAESQCPVLGKSPKAQSLNRVKGRCEGTSSPVLPRKMAKVSSSLSLEEICKAFPLQRVFTLKWLFPILQISHFISESVGKDGRI